MFQISALQKALEESVHSVDLERANKEYQNLTEKYRDLLEKENVFVSKSEAVSNLEVTYSSYFFSKKIHNNPLIFDSHVAAS